MEKEEALRIIEELRSGKSLFTMNSDEIQKECAINIATHSIKRLIPVELEMEDNNYYCPVCGEQTDGETPFCLNENCGQLFIIH